MLINKLTDIDKANIDFYIKEYAFQLSESRFEPVRPIEYRLRKWNELKKNIFEIFGQNLILEKEVEIQADPNIGMYEIEHNLMNFAFTTKLYDTMQYERFYRIFNHRDLYYNKYSGEPFELAINDKIIKVQNGCKLNRLCGKIAKLMDDELDYKEFSIFLSQCSNQRTIKGTLCLSIHPLDYFTMSDNASDWDSCLSWINNGSWSNGTIAAMNDKTSIVAYLKSSHDMKLNNEFVWNNKKWREIFVLTNEGVVGIQGYPYHSNELERITLQWLAELATEKREHQILTFDRWGRDVTVGNYKIDFDSGYIYDDFCRGPHQGIIFNPQTEIINMSIAEKLYCPICGEYYEPTEVGEGRRTCYNCEDLIYCEDCERLVPREKAVQVGELWMCEDCYRETYIFCSECGEPVYVENAYYIGDPKENNVLCEDCFFKDEELKLPDAECDFI